MALKSTIAYPLGLLELASKRLPSSFSHNIVVQYCSLVFEIYAFPYRRQHKLLQHCSYIHYLELEQRFGRGVFSALNSSLNWLTNTNLTDGQSHLWQASGGKGIAKAYELTDMGYEAIRLSMAKYPLMERKYRCNSAAMRSRDSSGSNSIGGFVMAASIAINQRIIKDAIRDVSLLRSDKSARGTPALNYLRHSHSEITREESVKKLQNYQDKLSDIQTITRCTDIGKKGYIPQQYTQSSTGRWYCQGQLISLQNMPRQLRTIVFQGHYDYDVESCHYALFAQMASRHAFDTPVIDQLVANKQAFRLKIALSLGISVATVKKVLISLIYGSPLSPSLYCSLAHSLGKPTAEAFCNLEDIQSLHSEISVGSKIIVEGYKQNSRRMGSITNDIGRSCVISQYSKASLLSHLLQGAEAQILSSIGKRWGHLIILLMHDGFVTKKRLKTDMLREHVFKETGWNVEFSEALISISKCTEN